MTAAARRATALVAAAVLSFTACSSDGGGGGGGATLRVETITMLDAGQVNLSSVVVAGGRTAWTAGDGRGGPPHKVMLMERSQARELARTQFPDGTVNRVRLSDRWAVFVDVDAGSEAWRMQAIDLGSGERVTVTEAAPGDAAAPLPSPPAPSIDGDVVVWAEPADDPARHRIVAHDLATGTRRTLADAAAEQLAAGGGKAYYDDDSAAGRDVFAVPLDGSAPPAKVSRSGEAAQPAATRHGVAWVEPPGGDSTSIVVARPGRPPETLATGRAGSPAGHNPRVCEGFGLWDPLSGLHARAFDGDDGDDGGGDGDAEPVLVAPRATLNRAARWWCDGTTVVWAAFKDERGLPSGVVVHVARVVVGEARST